MVGTTIVLATLLSSALIALGAGGAFEAEEMCAQRELGWRTVGAEDSRWPPGTRCIYDDGTPRRRTTLVATGTARWVAIGLSSLIVGGVACLLLSRLSARPRTKAPAPQEQSVD